jgi:hypothetical protein
VLLLKSADPNLTPHSYKIHIKQSSHLHKFPVCGCVYICVCGCVFGCGCVCVCGCVYGSVCVGVFVCGCVYGSVCVGVFVCGLLKLC